jgi:hypothetical protein
MAARIRIGHSLSWSNENVSLSFSTSASGNQSGTEAIGNNQVIGATSEALQFGDVTTLGYLGLKNMNAEGGANIHYGLEDPTTAANAAGTLAPGDGVIIQVPTAAAGNSWYAISSSGNSNLFVLAIEA